MYHMPMHGFVTGRNLKAVQRGEELVFELAADEKTRIMYPFEFIYRIKYQLENNSLHICYEVENRDDKTMYFGVGGHPGFAVPFDDGAEFEDYSLFFGEDCIPSQILMSEDCFVMGEQKYSGLKDGALYLTHELFDHDALILKNIGNSVCLQAKGSRRAITLELPDMDYLGIWHKPHTKAGYVCIEPWSSLPSRKGITEELEKQENLICLSPGSIYRNKWSIVISGEERQV